jgi:hypothetical protein
LWRTDRVNELKLLEKGFINDKSLKNVSGIGAEHFDTKSYLLGEYTATPGKAARSKKNDLKNQMVLHVQV